MFIVNLSNLGINGVFLSFIYSSLVFYLFFSFFPFRTAGNICKVHRVHVYD